MTESIAAGQVLAEKYRVERLLGSGGMGFVLLASHLELQKQVALKLLHRELTDIPEAVSRFVQEGRAAARLRSEHVGKVLDVGRLPTGEAYLVMEFLEGKDLAAELEARGKLPVPTAVKYVLEACEAIAEAHAHGIIHRDLKPANLFLARTAYGEACVKVLDFGISKIRADADFAVSSPALTGSHTIMGSPSYMAPEQMRASRDVDARADIWALGAILYELIAGRVAFKGDTLAVVCSAVLNDTPQALSEVRTDVASGLESIIFKCLDKQQSRRFDSVLELIRALVPYGPEECRDAVERLKRLVGDSSSQHSSFAGADSHSAGSEPLARLTNDGQFPPTLSMLHQATPCVGGENVIDGAASPQGTAVVWSGTQHGKFDRPSPRRTRLLGMVGLTIIGVLAFFVWRWRTALPSSRVPASSLEIGLNSSNAATVLPTSAAELAQRPVASAMPSAAVTRVGENRQTAPSLDARKRGPTEREATKAAASASAATQVPAPPPAEARAAPLPAQKAEGSKPAPNPVAPSHLSHITDYGGRE